MLILEIKEKLFIECYPFCHYIAIANFKNTIMKKILLFLILCIGLSACTDESVFEEKLDGGYKYSLRQASDGKYDLLGFSYDITGDYLHVDEARYMVIDVDAFVAANKDRFYNPGTTIGGINFYSGATATDFLQEMQTKSSAGGGLNIGAVFSGSVTKKKESQTKYAYSSKYSFSRGDVVKRVKRLYLNTDVTTLSKYLKNSFKEDLNKYSADDFVKMYGTHVLTDITIGGRLTFTYKSAVTEESNYSRKKEIVEGGLKFTIGKFGADAQKSHESETIKQLNSKNANWRTQVDYYGGEGSGISKTFSSETGYPTTTFNLDSWEKSVTDKNAALVDINWSKAYPIYDFVSDPVKKTQIKAAVEKYVASKKIDVIELLPLYVFYNNSDKKKGHNHYTTTYPTIHKEYSNWTLNGVEGYILKNQLAGSIPLYEYYNDGIFDHYTTTDPNVASYSGWKKQGIAGYVYKSPSTDISTVPLYEFYNESGRNHFTSTNPNIHVLFSGWARNSITGYIYPLN